MAVSFGAGLHVAPGKAVDAGAYDQWTGRWSRLFVPSVVAAAGVTDGHQVLDVSTDVVKTRLHRARLALRQKLDAYLRGVPATH